MKLETGLMAALTILEIVLGSWWVVVIIGGL